LILWTDGANHRFEFHKSSQLFIRTHDEALSVVAMRVSNEDRSPIGIHGCDAAQLQPARLSLSAMISQYFICGDSNLAMIRGPKANHKFLDKDQKRSLRPLKSHAPRNPTINPVNVAKIALYDH
jgi:hypothetical protein